MHGVGDVVRLVDCGTIYVVVEKYSLNVPLYRLSGAARLYYEYELEEIGD